MIGIVPYINENGEISLTITPITSDLIDLASVQIGTPKVADIQLPTVDIRQLSTTVKIRDGDIVALGGLISKREKIVGRARCRLSATSRSWGISSRAGTKRRAARSLSVILQPILVNR